MSPTLASVALPFTGDRDTDRFPPLQLISSVVTQNWRDIVQSCELDNWKEALAALLTYAHPEEFAPLCGMLHHVSCDF